MNIEPGDLLVWRNKEPNAFEEHGGCAIVIEVKGNDVTCDFFPSGLRQTNTISSIKFWYKKA